ncbi:MAG: hypothetical protein COB22_02725 [Cycloclasticus sp.]|nr:MAG: hypothetical protein COB22_02725 [Cycloclasticus sp.]
MTESKFNSLVKTIGIFVALGVAVVIFIYMYQFLFNKGYVLGGTAAFGAFGDYIGGILNPILGFATVILLIYSIRIQMKELRESTIALKASQIAHEELAKTSKKELSIIEQGHLNQQSALKREALRNQLTENAENIIKTYDKLMNLPYVNASHTQFSLRDLLYNLTQLNDNTVENNIANISNLMGTEPSKRNEQAKKLHLESIKKNINQLVLVFLELKPMLEAPSLQKIWGDRLESRVLDCYGLTIFTEEEMERARKLITVDTTRPLI